MVCKPSQHVGPNNVASCWPTMLRAFARAFKASFEDFERADVVVPWLPEVFLSQSDGIGEENEVSLAALQYSVAQGEKNLWHPG